jgi:hypothetical protein
MRIFMVTWYQKPRGGAAAQCGLETDARGQIAMC